MSSIVTSSAQLGRTALPAEAVETLGVAGEDQVAFGGGDAREVGVDRPPRIGPVGARMGIVAGPHDPVDADPVAVVDGVVVGDVGVVEVLGDVLAGRLGEPGLWSVGPASEPVVELLLDVRHPAG